MVIDRSSNTIFVQRMLMNTTIRQRQLNFLGHVMTWRGLENLVVTGKVEGRRGNGQYLDSLSTCWTDNVSPTQHIRISEDGALASHGHQQRWWWHGTLRRQKTYHPTLILSLSSPSWPILEVLLTGTCCWKFAITWKLNIPPHLNCIATLPCETVMYEKQMPKQMHISCHCFIITGI